MLTLQAFREQLTPLMASADERPFTCYGSPLAARVFVVGFNPATTLEPFWSYWSDSMGFDREAFMVDYLRRRKLVGARPRIEAIVKQFPLGTVLETNICSLPTKRAADLRTGDRRTDVFRYLLRTVRPELVFTHSNGPIAFFEALTGIKAADDHPHPAQWQDLRFQLVGCPGPLWRMKVEDAEMLGQRLAAVLAGKFPPLPDSLASILQAFEERFRTWNIHLPATAPHARHGGIIAREGWRIAYSFGRDDGGEFLDYRASHRMMWGDEHVRVREDGGATPL